MVEVKTRGQAEQFLLNRLKALFTDEKFQEIKATVSEIDDYEKRISILLLVASISYEV